MPTREDAENLRKETDRLRSARLERERAEAEETRREQRQKRLTHARQQAALKVDEIHRSTRDLDELNVRLLWLRERLRNWEERNSQFIGAGAREVVWYLSGLAALAGCIVVDAIVLSLPSRVLSRGFRESMRSVIGNADWIVPVIAFAVSTSYLTIEFCVGCRLIGRQSSRIGLVTDRTFANFALFVLPLLTVAYTLINNGVFSNDPFKVIGPGAIAGGIASSLALGAAALVVHGFVLYYSDEVAEGFNFIYFKTRELRLRFQINQTIRRINRSAGHTEQRVRRLVDHYQSTNDEGHTDSGLFSDTAVRVANDLFGREVIQKPPDQDNRSGEQANEGMRPGKGPEIKIVPPENGHQAHKDNEIDELDPNDPDGAGPGFDWVDEDEVLG